MVDPASIPATVVFMCGDDEDAKRQATSLLGELAWPAERVIDLGDISNARGPEMYVMLWVRLMAVVGGPALNVILATPGG